MDENARAIFDEARENLRRLRNFKVEHREHRTDGFSSDWHAGMPKQLPLTLDDIRREIAEALAKRPNGLTSAEVETLIADKFAAHDHIWHDVVGQVIVQLRGEIAKAATMQGSNEFFYIDENGNKQDAELHGPILRAVDGPFIDERIMGPIRAKHRARWLDEQRSQRRAR